MILNASMLFLTRYASRSNEHWVFSWEGSLSTMKLTICYKNKNGEPNWTEGPNLPSARTNAAKVLIDSLHEDISFFCSQVVKTSSSYFFI